MPGSDLRRLSWLFFTGLIAGCGSVGVPPTDVSSADATDVTSDVTGDAAVDSSSDVPSEAAVDASTNADAGTPMVMFSYHPQWSGVTAVTVIGAFGRSDDWTMPFATLTNDGTGTFTAMATVPPGDHMYLFKVTGDEATATPTTYSRYAIDPTNAATSACPMASPSFTAAAPNPCSVISVPLAASTAMHHVRGTVVYDGSAIADYLVLIEREEMSSHHFFANRVTTGTDGTFDLAVTDGHYRIQVLHPTFLRETDMVRSPATLLAARRSISTAFAVSADVSLDRVELAYHGYDQLSPPGTATVTAPVHFVWTIVAGATTARAAVYGPGASIGDPWWASPYGTATTIDWDGTFTTAMARQPMAMTGMHYWWGTWQQTPASMTGGVAWARESMVLPLDF